jgi:uncharacterized membrane protein YvbJ
MNTVFCRGCAKEIGESTRFCPACGAAQTLQKNITSSRNATYASYQEVPWFRKRWFAVICCLFFSPALLFILFTGDIYFEKQGKVTSLPKYSKIILAIVGVIAIIRVIAAMSQ